MKKILFIGDIIGKPGRTALATLLPELREKRGIDFVVANGENAAGGNGLTAVIANEIKKTGVDAITLGDHVWDQKGFDREIDTLDYVCRPANLPQGVPGRKYLILEKDGFRFAVMTLLGRNFMKVIADCPFRTVDTILNEIHHLTDATLIELHAETTSEKTALGWYLDGRASLVVGTHTHIPTADGRILPRGTAYLTDAGMTGPYASCLGRDIQAVIGSFYDGMPRKFEIAQEDIRLCGCLVEITDQGIARSFEQIILPMSVPASA